MKGTKRKINEETTSCKLRKTGHVWQGFKYHIPKLECAYSKCEIDVVSEKLPEDSGIYVFADAKKIVKYIGKAVKTNLNDEAESARKRNPSEARGATLCFWCQIKNIPDGIITEIEAELIHLYDPVNNDNHPKVGREDGDWIVKK